jgi:AraC-like DNA-binding protein
MAQEPRVVERAPYDEPELWRVHLGSAFSDLAPEALEREALERSQAPTGALRGLALGAAAVFRVSGTPQVVRRTTRAVRGSPGDFLKVCVQLRGRATVHQDGREIVIEPGRLAVYDTGRPYALRLEGRWSCVVMAVRRDAIDIEAARLHSAMEHIHLASEGPGLLLSQFITATVDQLDAAGPAIAGRLGDAGACLLSGTLAEDGDVAPADAPDALREHVLAYIDRRLADPRLSRTTIAAAHRMSPRTLDRLFGGQPWSVSGYIRHRRLEAVRRDLEDPALLHRSVAALAARWCFVDAAHFSRVFSGSYGFPPSQARPSAPAPADS